MNTLTFITLRNEGIYVPKISDVAGNLILPVSSERIYSYGAVWFDCPITSETKEEVEKFIENNKKYKCREVIINNFFYIEEDFTVVCLDFGKVDKETLSQDTRYCFDELYYSFNIALPEIRQINFKHKPYIKLLHLNVNSDKIGNLNKYLEIAKQLVIPLKINVEVWLVKPADFCVLDELDFEYDLHIRETPFKTITFSCSRPIKAKSVHIEDLCEINSSTDISNLIAEAKGIDTQSKQIYSILQSVVGIVNFPRVKYFIDHDSGITNDEKLSLFPNLDCFAQYIPCEEGKGRKVIYFSDGFVLTGSDNKINDFFKDGKPNKRFLTLRIDEYNNTKSARK